MFDLLVAILTFEVDASSFRPAGLGPHSRPSVTFKQFPVVSPQWPAVRSEAQALNPSLRGTFELSTHTPPRTIAGPSSLPHRPAVLRCMAAAPGKLWPVRKPVLFAWHWVYRSAGRCLHCWQIHGSCGKQLRPRGDHVELLIAAGRRSRSEMIP